jgi:hypothetical protein
MGVSFFFNVVWQEKAHRCADWIVAQKIPAAHW